MNCPACQRPIRRGAQFCTHCGAHIAFDEAPEAAYHDHHDAYDDADSAFFDDGAAYDDDAYYDEYDDGHLPPHNGPMEDAHGIYVEHDDYALEAVDAFEVRDISHPGLHARSDEESLPPIEDVNASQELEAILARLTGGKAEDSPDAKPRHVAAAEKALTGKNPTGADEDSFVLGGDFNTQDDGFSLGNDDDSGPIPVSAEDIEQTHRERTESGDAVPMSVVVRDWLVSARERASAMPRQLILIIVAALLVFTLGYVVLSSGDSDESSEASASDDDSGLSVSTDMDSAAQPVQPAEDAIDGLLADEADPAEYAVINEGAGNSGSNNNGGSASSQGAGSNSSSQAGNSQAPDSAAGLANDPANALLATAKPASTSPTKIPRPCVLREGPASKFRLVKSLVPAHSTVTVIAQSDGNWRTATQGDRSGWTAPGCKGNCTLRRGPGKDFKQVTGKDDSVKPRRPVTSSSRWKYIEFDGAYGWTGPACWK